MKKFISWWMRKSRIQNLMEASSHLEETASIESEASETIVEEEEIS